MKSLNNETIDLVCCDPPFAKNQTFKGTIKPPLSPDEIAIEKEMLHQWGVHNSRDAAELDILWPYDQAANDAWFKDIWRYEKVIHEDWVHQIEEDWQTVSHIIKAALYCHDPKMAAYITYMAVRIIEIHRILKPTGSFFIHCDQTASHYLKGTLDAIFGENNFRNEITWLRAGGRAKGSQHAPKAFGNDCDSILFYAKSKETKFNATYTELSKEELKEKFPEEDDRGRYNTGTPLFCQPSMGDRPNLCYEYKGVKNPHPSGWRVSKEKLIEMDKRGEIIWRGKKRPLRKSYMNDYLGKPMGSMWSDIQNLTTENEATGYPTQKPIALAERIIKAATDKGDVILDPFAGCAYVPVAAEKNNRQWIACDISIRAHTILKRQFRKFGYVIDKDYGDQLEGISIAEVSTKSPHEMPTRSDKDPVLPFKPNPLADVEYKVPSSDIPEPEMKRLLLELSGYQAWCCGFANRKPDGTIIETTNNFQLDHIEPKSQQGSNKIVNRAPLCAAHNQLKRDRAITLKELRKEIKARGEMQIEEIDLVDLIKARDKTLDIFQNYKKK